MTQFAPEMGLLIVVMVLCFFMILNAMNGRISRMDQYIHNLDFEIFDYREKSDGGAFYYYLGMIGYTYIIFPFVAVLYWGILLIIDSSTDA